MRRNLFTLASAVSLLICLSAIALWIQSIGCATSTGYVHDESCADFGSIDGVMSVMLAWDVPGRGGGIRHWFSRARIQWHPPSLFRFQFARTKAAPDGNWRFGNRRLINAAIPYWFLVSLTGVLPLGWLAPRLKRRLRTQNGYCPACGYNLTANTTGICSECGVTITEAGARRDRRAQRATILVAILPLLSVVPFAKRTVVDQYREHVAWKRLLEVQQQYLDYAPPPDRIAYTEDPATGRRLLAGNPNFTAIYTKIGNGVCYIPSFERVFIPGCFFAGTNGGPPVFLHARQAAGADERLVVVAPISVLDAEDLRADVIMPASSGEPVPRTVAQSQLVIARPFGHHFTFLSGQPDGSDSSHFTIAYSIDNHPGTIDGWLLDGEGVKMQVRDGPAKTLFQSTKARPFKSSWMGSR